MSGAESAFEQIAQKYILRLESALAETVEDAARAAIGTPARVAFDGAFRLGQQVEQMRARMADLEEKLEREREARRQQVLRESELHDELRRDLDETAKKWRDAEDVAGYAYRMARVLNLFLQAGDSDRVPSLEVEAVAAIVGDVLARERQG